MARELSDRGILERDECKAHLDRKGIADDSPIRSTQYCDENPGCPYFNDGLGDCPVARYELEHPTDGLNASAATLVQDYVDKAYALWFAGGSGW